MSSLPFLIDTVPPSPAVALTVYLVVGEGVWSPSVLADLAVTVVSLVVIVLPLAAAMQ